MKHTNTDDRPTQVIDRRGFLSALGATAGLLAVGAGSANARADATGTCFGGTPSLSTDGPQAVAVGGQTTRDIVVEGATHGVGALDFTLSVADGGVATIAEAAFDAPDGALTSVDIASDGTSATFRVAYLGSLTSEASCGGPVGTVTLSGLSVGTTSLSFDIETIGTPEGEAYSDFETESDGGAIETVDGDSSVPQVGGNTPGNLDDDPLLEDVDGDGEGTIFDALTYYNERDSPAIQNNPDYFDYDGDGTPGTVFDTIELYRKIS